MVDIVNHSARNRVCGSGDKQPGVFRRHRDHASRISMKHPTSSSHHRLALSALASALLVSACTPPAAAPPPVTPVFVNTVRNDPGTIARVLPASLRPRVEADLSFRSGGQVTARAVELGQMVAAGEVLGRIDTADYELAVAAVADRQRAAEVDAAQAASDAARLERLLADGLAGAAEAERQRARADAAAARLAQVRREAEVARNRAGYAVLTAPFDGIVTTLSFEVGQVVGDGQPVLSLAQPGELEVQADIPETLAAGLAGWQASASVPGIAQTLSLELRELSPVAAHPSRTYRARFSLSVRPPHLDLRIGMTAASTCPHGRPIIAHWSSSSCSPPCSAGSPRSTSWGDSRIPISTCRR
jgi:membrane fusion protein, multidrug efflux system